MAGDRARGRAGGSASVPGDAVRTGIGMYRFGISVAFSTSVTFLFFQRVCDTIIETWPLAI